MVAFCEHGKEPSGSMHAGNKQWNIFQHNMPSKSFKYNYQMQNEIEYRQKTE